VLPSELSIWVKLSLFPSSTFKKIRNLLCWKELAPLCEQKEKMLEQYRKELEAELSAVNELLKEKI